MKQAICLVGALLPAFGVWGQDWAPVRVGAYYHYETPLAQPMSSISDTLEAAVETIWVDSVGLWGSDSIFFLNVPYTTTNDTAIIACDNFTGAISLAYPEPLFLRRALVRRGGGIYESMEGGNAQFWHTWAMPNDIWVWDTVQNISATVSGVGVAMVPGGMDSVKTISFSNGDTAVLSKTHGFVRFPHMTDNREYVQIADEVPQYSDFCWGYSVGDIIMYDWWDSWDQPGNNSYGYYKVEILSKTIQPDTVRYGRRIRTWSHIENSTIGINADFAGVYTDTIGAANGDAFTENILIPDHYLPDAYNGDIYPYTSSATGLGEQGLVRTFKNQDNQIVRLVWSVTPYSQDTLQAGCEAELYVPQWGHSFILLNEPLASKGIRRVGHIHNGDTTGMIMSDSLMVVSVVETAIGTTSAAPVVYPNPTQDYLTVQWQAEFTSPVDIQGYNLQGQQMLQVSLPAGQCVHHISLQGLPAGLYVLAAQTADGQQYRWKVQKQE